MFPSTITSIMGIKMIHPKAQLEFSILSKFDKPIKPRKSLARIQDPQMARAEEEG